MLILLILLLILFFTLITPLSHADTTCTIGGVAYDYLTLEPLPDTIIEINTTPPQTYVSKDGNYRLNVPEGSYHLTAKHYENNLLEYYTEENITVAGGGDYTLDLIMLPAIEDEFLFDEPDLSDFDDVLIEDESQENQIWLMVPAVIAFIVIITITGWYLLFARSKKIEEGTTEAMIKSEEGDLRPLPDDLLEIVEILKKHDGRMTQKELRKLLPHSESKISLMITDLENRGIVTRVKRGRGNVILLESSQ
ncbi:MAG: membrane-associated protein/domain protein [Candidatus Syntrophoarchaeum caldarius]|uniref:Membrane-associated protein/domain protein n=1 Tax=Candidatus Syntropharchaeum caldarium TaxID=1838285 RepID=A0A1F2PBB7_9EURY|nr:MAG: membrane-associated protein/domain protein [Candidatus Syntrophoarchaeum caldarius]